MTVAEWDAAHAKRLMIAGEVDFRVVQLAERWKATKIKGGVCWLDVGCGTALSAEWLSKEGFDVCGFDGSPHAIGRALHRLTAKKNGHPPRLVVADAAKPWPYRADAFDALVDVRSLENLTREELDRAWEQAARVLKPGGWLLSVMAFPERDDALTTVGKVVKLTHDQVCELVHSVGLELVYLARNRVAESPGEVDDWHVVAKKPGGPVSA